MKLIKPNIKSEWDIAGQELSLYFDASPLNESVESLVSGEGIQWVSYKESEESEESNISIGYTIENSAILLSRKLMATLLPYQQDFSKKYGYSYSSLIDSVYMKNLTNADISTYEKVCSADDSTLSVIYFINDNYSGGDMYFPEYDTKISPKKNQVLIYSPSLIEYEIEPITDGEQYLFSVFLS